MPSGQILRRTLSGDAPAKLAFLVGMGLLAFAWGVATVKWKVFPHRMLSHVEAGIDAIGKMDDDRLPQHVLEQLPPDTPLDRIGRHAAGPEDDAILMTGGFFYRQDICPRFGCMAWIMDRSGQVLHKWEYDPARLFDAEKLAGFSGFPGVHNVNVQGVTLDRSGNLVVTFQGRNVFPYQIGIAKFDWSGDLVWIRIDNSHHWPTTGPDGRIYVPVVRIEKAVADTVARTRQPTNCRFGAVFQEGVRILDPDGTEVATFWMEDAVATSDAQALAYAVRNDCDPYHVNAIALLNEAAAAKLPRAGSGDLLVSLRSSSSLVVMDRKDGHIKHILFGPMVAQHSPVVRTDGTILLFDNLGGVDTPNGTRVLSLDPGTREGKTVFPTDAGAPGGDLLSIAQGAVAVSADGSRGIVSETLGGRVFEFDIATGRTLWSYEALDDLAPYLRFMGERPDGPVKVRLQTQGAEFVDLSRLRTLAALR